MEIIFGKSTGFCSGVQRAIKGVKKALKNNARIYCLGEIIHNPEVVESLKGLGMVMVDDVSSIPDKSKFIIRSHGLPEEDVKKAEERGLEIFDFTCPKVKKIHKLVRGLTKEGYFILIIGNPKHPEVEAIMSLTYGNARVIEKIDDLKPLPHHEQVAVVVQTTFNPVVFLTIAKEIISNTKKTMVYNTLCEETLRRQQEARELSGQVDFIIVVGGKNSSNTRTLYELVKERVPSVHIEGAFELRSSWFKNIEKVGIISGASTPEEEVKKVYDSIRGFSKKGIYN